MYRGYKDLEQEVPFEGVRRLSDLQAPMPQMSAAMPGPRQVDFQPRPMGGEQGFNPFSTMDFQQRPMGGEMPPMGGPRQMDFQGRPQSGEAKNPYGGPRGGGPYRMQDLLDLWWRR